MNKNTVKDGIFLVNNLKYITRNNRKNKSIHFMKVENTLTNANREPVTLRTLLKNNKITSKDKYKTTNTSRSNRKSKNSKSTANNNCSSIVNPKMNNKKLRLFSVATYNPNIVQKTYSNLVNKTYLINPRFKSTSKTKNLFYSITFPSQDFNDKVKEIDFMKNICKNTVTIINSKKKEFSKDLISLNTKESTFNNGRNYGYKNPDFFQKYDNLRLRANNLLNKYVELIENLSKSLRMIKDVSNSVIA